MLLVFPVAEFVRQEIKECVVLLLKGFTADLIKRFGYWPDVTDTQYMQFSLPALFKKPSRYYCHARLPTISTAIIPGCMSPHTEKIPVTYR